MNKRKILFICFSIIFALCVLFIIIIYNWNIKTTNIIHLEFAKLVNEKKHCVLVEADKLLKPRFSSPHNKVDSIDGFTALSLIRRRMAQENPTGSAGFWLAVVVTQSNGAYPVKEVYNWSFRKNAFVPTSNDVIFLFGLPQNSNDDACAWR